MAANPRAKAVRGGMATNGDVLLNIPAEMVADLKKATEEIPYSIGHAANIFGMLQRLTGSGFPLEENELNSLCELCSRGLHSLADKEGETIANFDMILREYVSPWKSEDEE